MKEVTGNLISMGLGGEFDVIIHGCNCFCVMGGGIAREVKARIPEAYAADQATVPGDPDKLGLFTYATVITNAVEDDETVLQQNQHQLTVVNAYTQYDMSSGEDVFEYDAFRKVLRRIYRKFGPQRYGIPLIGCGLAGGDEVLIRAILEDASRFMDLTLVLFDGGLPKQISKKR